MWFALPRPPLRERRSDIVPLAEHFLRLYSENNGFPVVGFSEEAMLMMQTYSYPGNVRELENMVERAVLMARGRVIMPSHFPQRSGAAVAGFERVRSRASWLFPFTKPLDNSKRSSSKPPSCGASGNKTEAANQLQINRRLLYQKMAEHEIKE